MGTSGINWPEVIKTLGIVTLALLAAAVATGYFMPKNRKLLFKWHRIIGFTALVLAVTHAVIVIVIFGI
jgi:hypothetical protein